jgi:CheY-like chemotaxis protein
MAFDILPLNSLPARERAGEGQCFFTWIGLSTEPDGILSHYKIGGETMNEHLGRILLVEDDERDVELALTALEEHRLANEVVVARDGKEALDYLYRRGQFAMRAEGNPVVVLLDLKMPKVDGLEVLRQVRLDQQLKVMPIVVLTSSREEQDLIESYKLGVNAYVVKPVDFHEFVDAVKELGVFWAVINEPPPGSIRKAK